MAKLQDAVIAAILAAVLESPSHLSILSRIYIFFSLIRIPLQRFQDEQFKRLRKEAWAIDEEEYRRSFQAKDERGRSSLHALSELGYSGSVSMFLSCSPKTWPDC